VLLLLQLLSFAGASATHAAMSAHGMPASVQGGAGCAGADCGDMMMTAAAASDCCHAGVVTTCSADHCVHGMAVMPGALPALAQLREPHPAILSGRLPEVPPQRLLQPPITRTNGAV